jgi:quercetin dioxygenase-like cupin family protein
MSQIIKLYDSIEFPKKGILSRTLFESASGEIDLFTIPKGQKISGHTSSRDAAVQIIRGEADFLLGEEWHRVKEGDTFFMEKGLIHAITAVEDLAFLLTLFGK